MRSPSFIIFILVALLLAGFVGVLAYLTFAPPSTQGVGPGLVPPPSGRGGAQGPALQPPTRPVVSSTDPIRGDVRASVIIVEFGDFLCEPCAEVEATLATVLAQYKGRVKLVWKDMPNTGRHALSDRAAQAARCAGEQDAFWDYHDRLLANQASIRDDTFTQIARELRLDTSQFADCLTSGRTAALTSRTLNEGRLLKVDATPYFFVGAERFSGAISVEELKTKIDAAHL